MAVDGSKCGAVQRAPPTARTEKDKAPPREPESNFLGSCGDANGERFSERCRWLRRESAELLIVKRDAWNASQNFQKNFGLRPAFTGRKPI
jgi:hypothetical protein